MSNTPVHAPKFPDDADWLNTTSPPNLSELCGSTSVVVVGFWSHSDIESATLFSELESLSRSLEDRLNVVGVHTPAFPHEEKRSTMEHAVRRLDTSIPIMNDSDRSLKREYGVSATPTWLVLDPDGNVVGTLAGRTRIEQLRDVVGAVLERHDIEIPDTVEAARPADRESSAYPGYVAVDSDRDRVAISDPPNHQVKLFSGDGELKRTIGAGFGDAAGDIDEARFSFPRGITFSESGLYVCDTGNHRVKGIDLVDGTVHNLLGNGRRGEQNEYRGPAEQVGLQAPCDVTEVDNELWVTMASGHQVWRFSILEEELHSFLGTGAEGFQDGPHSQVTMAQPTGITVHGDHLYFLDSRSSALRRYDPSEDWVETVVGKGLFQSGDVDGDDEDAMMSFPLGLESDGDHLYVADTYNHKIKRFDPEDGEIESWLGTGEPDDLTGSTTGLFEPSDVAFGGNQLYLNDTNNHRCLSVDQESWQSASFWDAGDSGISL